MLEHITNDLAGKTIKSVSMEPAVADDSGSTFVFSVVFNDGSRFALAALAISGINRCPNTNMKTPYAYPA